MNPDLPKDECAALEASLTALLLGELPHEQAAALHHKLAQDAELAKLYERLKQTINLVRETVASPAAQTADQPTPLKLSDQRRQKLLQHFKTVAPKEFAPPRRRAMPWLVPVGIAAGLVVILGALFLPALSKAKSKAQSVAFRTWSLSGSVASTPPAAALPQSLNEDPRLDLAYTKRIEPAKELPSQPGESKLPAGVPARIIAANSAIVLPQSRELADATTTPPVAEALQPGFAVSGTNRRLYDDSLGQGGGMGGGGAFGSSKGKTVSTLGATEDLQKQLAAAGSFSADPEWTSSLEPPNTVPGSRDKAHMKQGSFVNRYAYIAVQEGMSTLANPAGSFPAASVPLQAHETDKTLGDVVAGLRAPAPSGPAIDVKNGGEILPNPEVARSDSAENPADTKDSKVTLAGVTTTLGAKRSLMKATSSATPSAGPAAAEPGESKQALVGATQAYRAASYYGGNFNSQEAPSDGTQFVEQNRPVLRSPKEGGPTSLPGAVAMPAAPVGPQETAVNEAVLRQAVRLPSPQNVPAFKGAPNEVPVLGDVPVVGQLFRSAPGAAGGSMKADTGTPTTPPASGKQDGFAFLSLDPETHRIVNISDEATAKHIDQVPTNPDRSDGETGRLALRGANAYDLGVVGYSNVPLRAANTFAGVPAEPSTVRSSTFYRQLSQLGTDARGESQVAGTPIVLPPTPETTLAPQDKGGKDVRLLAYAAQPGAAPEGARKQAGEDAAKTRPYFEAKRELDELQRFRQVLDVKIASEKIDTDLPKTMTVEIVDKAVPQPAQSLTLGERVRSVLGGQVERTARIKIERDQSDISGMARRRSVPGYDPYFVQTEFELIQSELILGKVIKDLNLNEAWGQKQGGRTLTTAETMALLKKKLDLRPERNTSLVDIGVKSDQPEEAAKIANAVAEAYKAHRLEQRMQLSRGGIKALEERFAEQEQKVREAQKKVDDLRVKLQVSDTMAAQTNQTDVVQPKPTAPAAIPQPEVQTSDNAFSTFSLNVSDVSFKLAAASLEKGLMPEPATVRSEEFINAFDYRDPEPPPGVPVAFAWERAQYPFAQNRDLLRFSIKTAALGRQPGRPLNLVLLLDNSGSMERADRVRIIHEALRVLAGQLQPQDKFSVVTFARTAHLWVDGVPGSQAAQVAEEVSGLTPQGGTNLEEAMNLAYQTALRHYLANGVNRVVLLTDGAANLGNVEPEALKQKVEAHRKQGVALDCLGIGWEGYNDDLLEVLSRNGDGRYAFLNSPEEVASEFAAKLAGALQVAASDVKVQVEFNPGRVTAYRQIGYAKHQLTKEQFRDNTVSAAQIGAAEAGNALYTVEVNPAGAGPLCTVRVRFRIPGTADYREHAWDVPFTSNALPLEQSSPAMRLAATASAFSEWLVSSPYAGEVTPDRLLGYFSGVPEVYGADARPKKLEWMIRQAKSIAGK